MDGVTCVEPPVKLQEVVSANELIAVFESYLDQINVLSLDCFDTLLWRKTATPLDVFYHLQHRPTFQKIGLTALMRSYAETNARSIKAIQSYMNEVCLRDIYRFPFPELSENDLLALEEEELATEIEICYAFPPFIELIRAAHAKKIPIIIVSDTYFKRAQLKQLLATHLPPDVMQMIQEIFCSCEYGCSKSFGLFKLVAEKLALAPETILHIGDNSYADYIAPRREKIRTIHFIQYGEKLHEILRMQAVAAKILDPTIRDKRALLSPYRGFFSTQPLSTVPEEIIGYNSLGQIMYAFGRFILAEVARLRESGKKVKVGFLMRDAYLPSLVSDALLGESLGKCLSISRFASYAATFRTIADVDQYLSTTLKAERFESYLSQLLIPDEMAEKILAATRSANNTKRAFINLVHQEDVLAIIFKNSKTYYERLKRYLENQLDLQSGDTLMLVDLGYTGTTQKLLESMLRTEMNVEVVGRYLISLCAPGWNTDVRRGLMDASWCDSRTLHAFVIYSALLEQLCTSNAKSVIDYDKKGEPIFTATTISSQQHDKLKTIQDSCLRFVTDVDQFFKENNLHFSNHELREAAQAELGRLLFLPTANEIACLESFKFEMNLGTTDMLQVFNQQQGVTSLRRRGVFFSHMEKHGHNMRTNIPAEMRANGFELGVMLFTHNRFGFEVYPQDASFRREKIEIIILKNNQVTQACIEAQSTYDGFYTLNIPLGEGGFQIGILFGKKYSWLQFESIEKIVAQVVFKETESLYTDNYWDKIIFSKMIGHEQKLFECQSTESLMMIPALPIQDKMQYLIRVCFRPVALR